MNNGILPLCGKQNILYDIHLINFPKYLRTDKYAECLKIFICRY